MVNKLLVVAVMLLAAMSARAQIGYKGQVALGVSGGIVTSEGSSALRGSAAISRNIRSWGPE